VGVREILLIDRCVCADTYDYRREEERERNIAARIHL
jgi:hypothetical protein